MLEKAVCRQSQFVPTEAVKGRDGPETAFVCSLREGGVTPPLRREDAMSGRFLVPHPMTLVPPYVSAPALSSRWKSGSGRPSMSQ